MLNSCGSLVKSFVILPNGITAVFYYKYTTELQKHAKKKSHNKSIIRHLLKTPLICHFLFHVPFPFFRPALLRLLLIVLQCV